MLTFAAIAAAGPLMVAAGEALADPKPDRGGGRGREERQDDRKPERRYERDDRRYEGQERRMERRLPPPPRAGRGDPPGRYSAPPGWRRGAYLPPAYRGERIYAYGRHRLRPPPSGYAWYRVGDDYLLTQMVSGMVVEVVRD
ncbi:RcnB family protein [Phenylobacterium sp.]|uniref:RcnB family protein n=1 Tax=Phenylobacterium sp. TaxID=1871053 RepID=UPI002E371079|nr:RcnB family protein [Phenylobacterium sp.]